MLSEGPSSPLPPPPPLQLPCTPCPPPCSELDLSLQLSPPPKQNHPKHPDKPRPHRPRQQSHPTHLVRQPDGSHRRKQVRFKEPVVVKVTAEPPGDRPGHDHPRAEPTGRQRARAQRGGRASGQKPDASPAPSNQIPGCVGGGVCLFEEAEPNSSLALKMELQTLQDAEFNSQEAVQETLRKSTRAKNLINTRATEGVNVSHSQLLYTSLVSLAVQKEQLIRQMGRDRRPPAPITGNHDNKTEEAPSLVHFFTADLLREKPCLPEDEPIRNKSPRDYLTSSAHSALDPYRRYTH